MPIDWWTMQKRTIQPLKKTTNNDLWCEGIQALSYKK